MLKSPGFICELELAGDSLHSSRSTTAAEPLDSSDPVTAGETYREALGAKQPQKQELS